jgi:hypothetical protein
VEGGLMAKDKWPGIHFPGGSGYNKMSFIMIYGNKWSLWKPGKDSSGNVKDEPIGESTPETETEEIDNIMRSSVDGVEENDESLREPLDEEEIIREL